MSREVLEEQLRQSLARLETCLATPRVSGELLTWTKSVQDALKDLRPHLKRQLETVHGENFAQIRDQDPGLLTRVEQLKAVDAEIAEQCVELTHRIERIAQNAPHVEPDELQLERDIAELADEGLLFVLRVRKQETAITTWLVEAFDRDRGTVD